MRVNAYSFPLLTVLYREHIEYILEDPQYCAERVTELVAEERAQQRDAAATAAAAAASAAGGAGQAQDIEGGATADGGATLPLFTSDTESVLLQLTDLCSQQWPSLVRLPGTPLLWGASTAGVSAFVLCAVCDSVHTRVVRIV